MTHKMAPPPTAKPHKPEKVQKDSNQEDLRKNKPEAKTNEFGYAVTNQR